MVYKSLVKNTFDQHSVSEPKFGLLYEILKLKTTYFQNVMRLFYFKIGFLATDKLNKGKFGTV